MKKVVSILMALCMLISVASFGAFASVGETYYIDSINGNDSNSGKSVSDAWKTVENIRDLSLNPGDKILFKSDCVFTVEELEIRAKGTKENPIVISSFGEGEMPLLTTNEYKDIMWLYDCSYVTVSDLEMTAPNGGGIWINVDKEDSVGVTLNNLKIHDIQNYVKGCRDNIVNPKITRACVVVKNIYSTNPHPVNDLTISNCEFYDCGNGIHLWGGTNADTWDAVWTEGTPLEACDFYYNQNALIENCYFHDMDSEALNVGICEKALVTNCKSINCCQNDGLDDDGNMTHVAAAMWFWGSQHSTIQNTEIAGQKCWGDGMSVDFDSRSNYCTYQYIYSHDNTRFIRCCSPTCGQIGNTVRYCLSVNDNAGQNRLGTSSSQETNFKFYNNTIINSHSFVMDGVNNGYVANNIFVGDITKNFAPYKNVKNEDGTISRYAFTGTFTNNCIYGMSVPSFAQNTLICNPGFAGNDETDPNSYRLSENSRLLGAGVKIEGSGTDIYGNEIAGTNNIGCYAGSGEKEKADINILDSIKAFFGTAFGSVYQCVYEFVTKTFAF